MEKSKLLAILLVLVFAFVLAAQDFPASDWKVLNLAGVNHTGFIKKSPAGAYCIDDEIVDAATGNLICFFPLYQARDVDWDGAGNTWVASDAGLRRYGLKDTSTYLTTNGMPANSLRSLKVDRANNRLIVGTDNGLSVVKQDATGKPVSYQNGLSGQTFHKVGSYGLENWAVNSARVYHIVGSDTSVYDTGNSTINNPYGAFIAQNGNAYIGSDDGLASGVVGGYIAVFDRQAGSWSKIIPDSGAAKDSRIPSVVVDNQNVMWYTCMKYLVSVDLTTTKQHRYPLDGSVVSCLNDFGNGLAIPALGLTSDGYLLIAGNGAIVERKSTNAVRWYPVLAPKITRGSFQIIGQINPLGRLIKSFSPNSVSGVSFTLIRTAEGMKAVKTLIAR